MKKLYLLLIFLILLIPIYIHSAVTQTVDKFPNQGIKVINMTWTATSGSVSSTATVVPVDGFVLMVVTDPGSPAPLSNYDITLKDSNGVDVMGGELSDRHTSNTEQVVPKIDAVYGSRYVEGNLNLFIVSSSTTTQGIVRIYIDESRE